MCGESTTQARRDGQREIRTECRMRWRGETTLRPDVGGATKPKDEPAPNNKKSEHLRDSQRGSIPRVRRASRPRPSTTQVARPSRAVPRRLSLPRACACARWSGRDAPVPMKRRYRGSCPDGGWMVQPAHHRQQSNSNNKSVLGRVGNATLGLLPVRTPMFVRFPRIYIQIKTRAREREHVEFADRAGPSNPSLFTLLPPYVCAPSTKAHGRVSACSTRQRHRQSFL